MKFIETGKWTDETGITKKWAPTIFTSSSFLTMSAEMRNRKEVGEFRLFMSYRQLLETLSTLFNKQEINDKATDI